MNFSRHATLLLSVFLMSLTSEGKGDSSSEQSSLLARLLGGLPGPLAAAACAPEHEVQVIYVRVLRREGGVEFEEHRWRSPGAGYFYPASTVKLPVALFALEKLAALKVPGLDRRSPMLTDRARPWQTERHQDPTSTTGQPCVENDVRNIFLVSQNEAFNRLFELVGLEGIERRLQQLGMRQTSIVHRVGVRRGLDHGRYGNPIRFLGPEGTLLHQQEETVAASVRYHGGRVLKGQGFMANGELVSEPKDFSFNNAFPLEDQHRLLRALVYPETVDASHRLNLSEGERRWVLEVMGQFPRECRTTADESLRRRPDDYVKDFLAWCPQPIRGTLRCHNKSGQAYGYLVDNAYVVDREHGLEFFLAAVIHVNANGIYNDDQYEYETIGRPFMSALGKAVHDHERQVKAEG